MYSVLHLECRPLSVKYLLSFAAALIGLALSLKWAPVKNIWLFWFGLLTGVPYTIYAISQVVPPNTLRLFCLRLLQPDCIGCMLATSLSGRYRL